jgi:serine phosphatase RsbU (regulator of sigma subunit)
LGFAFLTYHLLARRDTAVALATENERLYDEQRHIAETLQLSLLPAQLDAPPGIVAAARYWPAGSTNLIGGDFYDLFKVDEGRWGIAIGDVCGKGIEAAALTGLARHTLRAAARHRRSPAEVLRAVHHAMQDHTPATFCTAAFAYLSPLPGSDSFRVEIALGGHPEPLLRHRDGRVEPIGNRGTLLGMIDPTLSTVTGELHSGDTLVLYTDGLTDAPLDEAVPIEEISDLLGDRGDEPIEQLADSIRVLKRRRRPKGSGDDTALLILRVAGPDSPAEQVEDSDTSVAVAGGVSSTS